jgi:hypothetical protein
MDCYRTAHQSRNNTSGEPNLKIETTEWNSNCFGLIVIKNIFDIEYRTCELNDIHTSADSI